MADAIPLFEITWDRDDVKNVVDSVTRGAYWANGPYIDDFETALEEYHDIEHAVVFNSGTTALVSALRALNIGPGDEVIVPSFTFISTTNVVEMVDAEPVFADIESESLGLDPDDVRDRITDDTAAILPVHYSGKPCKIRELREIATEHDLRLVEDAAEALGAESQGQKVGTFGDAGMLSFCQNKVVATGEGGAVLTEDDDVAREARLLRSHGRASGDYFDSASGGDYVALGNNFRMPDVVASIGVAQMQKVEDTLIAGRQRVAARYREQLKEIDGVTPPRAPADGRHVYQLFTVRFDDDVDRDAVVQSLEDENIASKVYFDPVHRSEYYSGRYGDDAWSLPTTDAVSESVLSLPMFPHMTAEDIDHVVDCVAAALD
jgi:perosamine synthetase